MLTVIRPDTPLPDWLECLQRVSLATAEAIKKAEQFFDIAKVLDEFSFENPYPAIVSRNLQTGSTQNSSYLVNRIRAQTDRTNIAGVSACDFLAIAGADTELSVSSADTDSGVGPSDTLNVEQLFDVDQLRDAANTFNSSDFSHDESSPALTEILTGDETLDQITDIQSVQKTTPRIERYEATGFSPHHSIPILGPDHDSGAHYEKSISVQWGYVVAMIEEELRADVENFQ